MTTADQPMRAALSGSLLLHGALLAAALLWLRPQPLADQLNLESIAVSIVNIDTASTDADTATRSDAVATTVAAGVRSVAAESVTPRETTDAPAVAPETMEPVANEAGTPVAAPSAIVANAEPVGSSPAVPMGEPSAASEIAEPLNASTPIAAPVAAVPELAVAASADSADMVREQAVPIQPAVTPTAPSPPPPVEPASAATVQAAPLQQVVATANAAAPPTDLEPASQKPVPTKPMPQRQLPTARPPKPSPRQSEASNGSGGRSAADARAAAPVRGGAGRVDAGGTAADSRYPGLVQARLRQALRFPAGADRASGEVQVQFTVLANGAASGASVVVSSGSAVLDQAAIDTVRRAAPFPPIPQEAGRSSWPFVMPLRFRR